MRLSGDIYQVALRYLALCLSVLASLAAQLTGSQSFSHVFSSVTARSVYHVRQRCLLQVHGCFCMLVLIGQEKLPRQGYSCGLAEVRSIPRLGNVIGHYVSHILVAKKERHSSSSQGRTSVANVDASLACHWRADIYILRARQETDSPRQTFRDRPSRKS